MIAPALQREPFTADLIATLRTLPFPVGDGEIPPGANWVGQPAIPGSRFKPYLVVGEIVASHSWGVFSDPQADWQLPYVVETFGLTRSVCGKLADKARDKVLSMRSHTYDIDGVAYGVMQVQVDDIGEPARIAALQPPVWRKQDGITLMIGKGAP